MSDSGASVGFPGCRTSHEVYGRSFGVSMNQFRDLHLKSHLTIAFLFTYNNKKGREW